MAIQSITTGPRQSNFEILRIIAMFFVLMVHANYMSINPPTAEEIDNDILASATRAALESISLLGVNLFVMISGWFSIKATVRGLSGLLFQVFYFGIGILLFLTIIGMEEFTIGRVYQIVMLHKSGWFVMSYLILYLLAPVLNKFSEYASKKEFTATLASYFAMLIIWGCIDWAEEIGMGYSALSMVGIYLLARYARKYIDFTFGGRLFFICWILNTILYLFVLRYNIPIVVKSYDNPLIISGAFGLFFYFRHLNVKTSGVVNYVARSTFAVYLLHIYPDVLEWFCGICENLYLESSGIICIFRIGGFLLAVYALSIVSDAPRRLIWSGLCKLIGKSKLMRDAV